MHQPCGLEEQQSPSVAPRSIGRVVGLFRSVGSRQPMEPLVHARAVPGGGLEGCRHHRPGRRRALLLVEKEVLDALGLWPGQIKENITVSGLGLPTAEGTLLRIGAEVVLRVTGRCVPCEKMDRLRPGLRRALLGRRGILAITERGGTIHIGDTVWILEAPSSASA
jgi:MOSC domain-containing protein YiiM